MERLYRAGDGPDDGPTETSVAGILADYEPGSASPGDRPFFAANMVTSLDGRAAVEGRSKLLGSERDAEVLLGLRSLFDALLIGAGTLRAEQYGPIIRDPGLREKREAAGLDPSPLAVVVTSSFDLPWDCPLFTEGIGKVVVFTGTDREPPPTATEVEVVASDGDPNLTDLAAWLAGRGIRSVLCEGGPTILGELVDRELLDELFLTIHPVITGEAGAPRIVEGPVGAMTSFELVELSREGDELFTRFRPRR
ncbi:MAG: dihydrofolate reductase family protein [Solirubrobacterales bacterium]